MRPATVEYLRDPDTGAPLRLDTFEMADDEVVSGRLIDPSTGVWRRIEEGVADLVPHGFRNAERYAAFCARHKLDNGPAPTASAKPDENAATQIKFFAEHRDNYEQEVVESPFYDVFDRVTLGRWIERQIRPGMRVVEIGAGSGRQTLPLLRTGADVIALDLSEDMLRLARAKALADGAKGRADFVVAAAETLPLKPESFDAGVIFGSLHHFSDPPAALFKAGQTLKAGAPFYLLEPHDTPLRFVFDRMMRLWMLWKEEANDEPLFTGREFTSWLGKAGLDTKISYSTYLLPHFFYVLKGKLADQLLAGTDAAFNALPGVRRLGGIVIAEAVKR